MIKFDFSYSLNDNVHSEGRARVIVMSGNSHHNHEFEIFDGMII